MLPNGTPIPVVLLANKGDVATDPLPVSDIAALCKKYDILAWFITSAKDNSNIGKKEKYSTENTGYGFSKLSLSI